MGLLKAYNWIRSSAIFKSIASGNSNNYSTYKIQGADGNYYNSGYTPESGNDLYIEAGTTVTLVSDMDVNNINYNTTTDIIRLQGAFNLNIWGKLRFYSGAAPGTSDSVNSGIAGWLGNGSTLIFKGTSDRIIIAQHEVNANNTNYGQNIKILFSAGKAARIDDKFRASNWDIATGILDNSANGTNVSNALTIGFNNGSGDNTPDGTLIIRSGATLIGSGGLYKRSTMACVSIAVEAGGTLKILKTNFPIGAVTLDFSGTIIISGGVMNLPTASGITSASTPSTFSTLWLTGAGAKALNYNTTVNALLILDSGSSLNLNTHTLSYGNNADLQINTSMTRGSELPALGSGTSIPRNLILPTGVVYNLNGATVNIRGILTKPAGDAGAGGSVTNGTLQQNQP